MSICPCCALKVGINNRKKVKGVWKHKSCPLEGILLKMKITDELMSKCNAVFNRRSVILTGEGLTRTELRFLERRGRIKRSYRQYGSTMRCIWMRPSPYDKMKDVEKLRMKILQLESLAGRS